jgi:hypothetical protein
VLGELIQGEFLSLLAFCDFEPSLVLLAILAWFTAFHAFCWACGFSLLLDDLLELFVGFWSSSCASWGLGFKLQTLCFCYQWTHQGRD